MSDISSADLDGARSTLVKLVQKLGGLDDSRFDELSRSTHVQAHDAQIEIRVDYLGEASWYAWDGSREGLDGIITEAAEVLSTTIGFERRTHGRTPWDA